MASGDRIYIADKTTLDEVNGKIGITTDTTQTSVMGKANAIIGEVTSTASKIGNSSDTGSTLFGKINNINSAVIPATPHYTWGKEYKSVAGGASLSLTITANTESAKVTKMGSFKFTNYGNSYKYVHGMIRYSTVTAGSLYSNNNNARAFMFISTYNTSSTNLSAYNSLNSNYLYRIELSSNSSVGAGGVIQGHFLYHSEEFQLNTTYYVYCCLYKANSTSPSSPTTVTIVTPQLDLQLYFLSNTDTITQNGTKWVSKLQYHTPTKSATSTEISSGSGLDSYATVFNNESILEPNCYTRGLGTYTVDSAEWLIIINDKIFRTTASYNSVGVWSGRGTSYDMASMYARELVEHY